MTFYFNFQFFAIFDIYDKQYIFWLYFFFHFGNASILPIFQIQYVLF